MGVAVAGAGVDAAGVVGVDGAVCSVGSEMAVLPPFLPQAESEATSAINSNMEMSRFFFIWQTILSFFWQDKLNTRIL